MHFGPDKPVLFDGSESVAPSSKIAEVFWDVGDSTTNNRLQFSHSYSKNYQLAFPLLRIKDANGFISDTYVQLSTSEGSNGVPDNQTVNKTSAQPNRSRIPWLQILVGLGILFVVVIVFLIGKPPKRPTRS